MRAAPVVGRQPILPNAGFQRSYYQQLSSAAWLDPLTEVSGAATLKPGMVGQQLDDMTGSVLQQQLLQPVFASN
jgi:hypothetical protein